MTTAEERYEETWNSYLVLLDKDPKASLTSFTKSKSVYYRGMAKWMSRKGLSVFDAKAKIRACHRKALLCRNYFTACCTLIAKAAIISTFVPITSCTINIYMACGSTA